jgi:hypothetical protein
MGWSSLTIPLASLTSHLKVHFPAMYWLFYSSKTRKSLPWKMRFLSLPEKGSGSSYGSELLSPAREVVIQSCWCPPSTKSRSGSMFKHFNHALLWCWLIIGGKLEPGRVWKVTHRVGHGLWSVIWWSRQTWIPTIAWIHTSLSNALNPSSPFNKEMCYANGGRYSWRHQKDDCRMLHW